MCPADDETGEAEDEDTATDDGETEIMEHHWPVLNHVNYLIVLLKLFKLNDLKAGITETFPQRQQTNQLIILTRSTTLLTMISPLDKLKLLRIFP